ncbi:MAG: DUF4422 domain-containing protein [Lachnospiraceae bacterium]|nr:DUF4422 domain-containing protein [Lachnospiraceae bacterium]
MENNRAIPDDERLKYKGTNDNPDIKIFVSNRIDLDSEIVDNPLYIPVRCGAVYDKRKNVEMLGDDTGDNISEKRMIYCELTVQYWAWKNIDADYYGLCHYRRYFNFGEKLPNIGLKQGVLDALTEENIKKIGIDDKEKVIEEIKKWDLIVTPMYEMGKDTIAKFPGRNARELWEKNCPNFLEPKSFDVMLNIIKELAPDYYKDAEYYMHRKKNSRGFDCYIMKKELFFSFCEFEYPLLGEFERRSKTEGYSTTQHRNVAYMSEWLYDIWIYHTTKNKQIKWTEKQLAVFNDTSKRKILEPINRSEKYEKTVPIVFALSDTNRFFYATVLQSIIDHSNDNYYYDIICLQQTYNSCKWDMYLIKQENDLLRMIIDDKDNFSLRFYDPAHDIGKLDYYFNNKRNEENLYYKLFLPWILKNYEKVIYVEDVMFFDSDVAELVNMIEGEGDYIKAAFDIKWIGKHRNYIHEKLDTKVDAEHVCKFKDTSLILFNLNNLRQRVVKQDVEKYLLLNIEKMEDNELFNELYWRYISEIGLEWNYLQYNEPNFSDGLTGYFDTAPSELTTEYNDIKEPKGININNKDHIFIVNNIYTVRWMNTIEKTPFKFLLRKYQLILASKANYREKIFKRIINKLFPYNSVRRDAIKKIVPHSLKIWFNN